jgi:DnaJ like chaperone protein
MKLIVLLFVGVVLYLISRSYKTENYQNINIDKKQYFDANIEDHEAGLLVALMAKVAKADGGVCELEAEVLKHTFTDISSHFENNEDVREKLKDVYKKEKESFENTLEIASKYYKLTKRNYNKRLKVMEYLLNLAFIDGDFSEAEYMITEDISNTLEIKRSDFDNMINHFKAYYANKASSTKQTLSQAYKVLDLEETSDFTIIKKQYRKLVRKYHPDIITGQGANKATIDEANTKLQEINEAYEIIKKKIGK